jgi:hypothetical protein
MAIEFLYSKRREEFLNQLNNFSFHETFSTPELLITQTFIFYITFGTCSENFLLVDVSTVINDYPILFLSLG